MITIKLSIPQMDNLDDLIFDDPDFYKCEFSNDKKKNFIKQKYNIIYSSSVNDNIISEYISGEQKYITMLLLKL